MEIGTKAARKMLVKLTAGGGRVSVIDNSRAGNSFTEILFQVPSPGFTPLWQLFLILVPLNQYMALPV